MAAADAQNIRVAVRVRPFSKNEQPDDQLVEAQPPSLQIRNPAAMGEVKNFTFDYVYDSRYPAPGNGLDQQQVQIFTDLGQQVVDNAWAGLNSSVFAYGQTGSGKTHTMMGSHDKARGLIPRICESLFWKLANDASSGTLNSVEVSYMEIYNEVIRDLLVPVKSTAPGGLKVRENPTSGPFVDGLSKVLAKTHEEVLDLIEIGTNIRTVASTAMNQQSSRSHAVFTLKLTQTREEGGKKHQKTSQVHLVDLAGSERIDVASAAAAAAKNRGTIAGGTQGKSAAEMRMKEGAAINKSLSALSNVIYSLAEMQSTKKKDITHIPYRDSVLTWLLKESLGGNAKTIMIATISPSAACYQESMSTLRYAERAKKIVNRAIVNEDSNAKLIRELREENSRLKQQLDDLIKNGTQSIGMSGLLQLKNDLESNEKLMEEAELSPEEQMRRAEEQSRQKMAQLHNMGLGSRSNMGPHLVNLNEDPMLSETLTFVLKPGANNIGREDAARTQDIKLAGAYILHEHCIIYNKERDGGGLEIHPLNKSRTFVNGHLITQPVMLEYGSRIVLGKNHVFRLDPPGAHNRDQPDERDWLYAINELNAVQGSRLQDEDEGGISVATGKQTSMIVQPDPELERRLKEMEEEMHRQQEQVRRANDERRQLEEKMAQEKRDMEQRFVQEQEKYQKGLSEVMANMTTTATATAADYSTTPSDGSKYSFLPPRERREYISRIEAVRPLIQKVNAISVELSKDVTFEIGMLSGPSLDEPGGVLQPPWDELQRIDRWRPVVRVLQSVTRKVMYHMSLDKFQRLAPEIEAYHQRMQGGSAGGMADPFVNSQEDCFIGRAWLFLQGLAHRVTMEHTLPILDHAGNKVGELNLTLFPTIPEAGDANDGPNKRPTPPAILDINEVLGNAMNFSLRLNAALHMPSMYRSGVYCKYRFWHEKEVHCTEKCTVLNNIPRFNYQANYSVANVSPELFEYLRTSAIPFEIWGKVGEAVKSLERSWEFFFRVDIEEYLGQGGKGGAGQWEPVTTKEQPLEKGGSVCIYKLRQGVTRRFVLSIAQTSAPDEDSVLDRCTSVRVGRLRRWQDGYSEVVNPTHFQISQFEVKKIEPTVPTGREQHELLLVTPMDAPIFDQEEFKRVSQKGEVFSLTVCVDIKLHIISTPYRFSHEFIFKVSHEKEKKTGFWSGWGASDAPRKETRRLDQMGSRTRISLAPGKASPEAQTGGDIVEHFERDVERTIRSAEQECLRQRAAIAQGLELMFGADKYRAWAASQPEPQLPFTSGAILNDAARGKLPTADSFKQSNRVGPYQTLWAGGEDGTTRSNSNYSSRGSSPPRRPPPPGNPPPPSQQSGSVGDAILGLFGFGKKEEEQAAPQPPPPPQPQPGGYRAPGSYGSMAPPPPRPPPEPSPSPSPPPAGEPQNARDKLAAFKARLADQKKSASFSMDAQGAPAPGPSAPSGAPAAPSFLAKRSAFSAAPSAPAPAYEQPAYQQPPAQGGYEQANPYQQRSAAPAAGGSDEGQSQRDKLLAFKSKLAGLKKTASSADAQ
eukprot:tig00000241_g20920.t1